MGCPQGSPFCFRVLANGPGRFRYDPCITGLRFNAGSETCISEQGVCAAGILAVLLMAAPGQGRAGGEWPDGPNKQWFQKLERPDNDKHPYRDPRSRSCCGAGDIVKTKFRVEGGDDKYPDDQCAVTSSVASRNCLRVAPGFSCAGRLIDMRPAAGDARCGGEY